MKTQYNTYGNLSMGFFGRSSDPTLPLERRIFPLIGSLFEKCSIMYDPDRGELRLLNSDEIYKCCLANCTDNIDFCDKYCDDKYQKNKNKKEYIECQDRCKTAKGSCEDICIQARELWGDNDPFFKSLETINHGDCVQDNIPDVECVRANKDELLRHCKKTCVPTSQINCDQHCDTSYHIIVDPGRVSDLYKIDLTDADDLHEYSNGSDNSMVLWISIFMVIVAMVGVILYIYVKK